MASPKSSLVPGNTSSGIYWSANIDNDSKSFIYLTALPPLQITNSIGRLLIPEVLRYPNPNPHAPVCTHVYVDRWIIDGSTMGGKAAVFTRNINTLTHWRSPVGHIGMIIRNLSCRSPGVCVYVCLANNNCIASGRTVTTTIPCINKKRVHVLCTSWLH